MDEATFLTAEAMEALKEKLKDPLWRLCSGQIYKIAPDDGSGLQFFIPRAEQILVYEKVYGRKWDPVTQASKPDGRPRKQIMIPKARRLGMSTALGILCADWTIFHKSREATLIDETAAKATKKLNGIFKVAAENVPAWLKALLRFEKSNDSIVAISNAGEPASKFYAVADARGGSNDILWVSEWGVIQFEDPARSSKIRSGSLPSARRGTIIVESTWAGGKTGDMWELMEGSLNGTDNDWEILFFAWWTDPRNTNETAALDARTIEYFRKNRERFDREGTVITEGQMRWYAKEWRTQGIFMKRENPSFLDECWAAPVKGSYYAEEIERARTEGRIGTLPIDPGSLVHTVWDLGAPLQTVVWYFQIIRGYIVRWIDCDHAQADTIIQRVARMKAKGYYFGNHYFPHDAKQTERSGRTMATEFAAAWLEQTTAATVEADEARANIKFIPRTHDVSVGINRVIQLFPVMEFRQETSDALEKLGVYRADDRGEPVHDKASHIADPIRYFAEAELAKLINFRPNVEAPEWTYMRESKEKRGGRKQPVRRVAGCRVGR